MRKILLVTSLIASTFWSVAAGGEGSIRGLLFESEVTPITIEIELDVPVEATTEDVEVVLNGVVLDTLNGDFSVLTGHDSDSGTLEFPEPFVIGTLAPGRRRLSYTTNVGGCRRCCRTCRRALLDFAGYKGAVTSAMKQWCNDMGKTNPCCKGKFIKGISYKLSE